MPVFTEETAARVAVLKLPDIGNNALLALVDIDNSRQARNIEGEPLFWDNGDPRMTKIVHAVVLETDGAMLGDEAAAAGDEAAIFVEGGTYVEWKRAVEEYGRPLATGMRIRWTYERDEPAKTRGYNARKIRSFKFGEPTAETAAQADRLYAARKTTVLETAPATGGVPAEPLRPEEAPF